MAEIRVPTLGELVTEATIGKWFKKAGRRGRGRRAVGRTRNRQGHDRSAGAGRRRARLICGQGRRYCRGRRAARPIKEGAGAAPPRKLRAQVAKRRKAAAPAAPQPRQPNRASRTRQSRRPTCRSRRRCASSRPKPAWTPSTVPGTGKDGRVTKGDMLAAIERAAAQPTPVASAGRRRAGARAVAARRRRARGARAHDAASSDHRAPAQGGAKHRRHAHDLQRGRHDAMSWRCARSTAICSRRSTA